MKNISLIAVALFFVACSNPKPTPTKDVVDAGDGTATDLAVDVTAVTSDASSDVVVTDVASDVTVTADTAASSDVTATTAADTSSDVTVTVTDATPAG